MDNDLGRYDLEVTTFQMAVLYAWNSRRHDRISFESLRLATGLPENELRRTVWVSLDIRAFIIDKLCYMRHIPSDILCFVCLIEHDSNSWEPIVQQIGYNIFNIFCIVEFTRHLAKRHQSIWTVEAVVKLD